MASRRRGCRSAVLLAVAGLVAVLAPSAVADDDGRLVFRIRVPEVTESSGLVASTTRRGLAYTVNDSGDDAVVYAIDTSTGELAGRTWLAGVDAYDIEALAGGRDGSLVVADVGDNSASRDDVSAYRIEEPAPGDRTVAPDVVRLRYADGPRDAESMLYDDASGRIFVVSKEFGDAHVYRTQPDVFDRGAGVLRPVGVAPPVATDATYLTDRRYAVVRGYGSATLLDVRGWTRVAHFDLPPLEQGESVTAPPDDPDVVWVGSEGDRSPVLAVRLPALPDADGGAGPEQPDQAGEPPSGPDNGTSTPAGGGSDDGDTEPAGARSVALWVGGVASAGLVVVLLLLLLRGRHSGRSG